MPAYIFCKKGNIGKIELHRYFLNGFICIF